ncbi:MAG: hypothetical protein KJZ86_11475 [Caldilineaceae bacterium]|nr:hypothetical protein [Caldilineaceae bacterium]
MGSREISLFLVALLAFVIVGWTALATDAAPLGQDEATPTPTPTITPTKPPVRNEITFPMAGDILFGFVRVEGTALIDNYREYQLHISPANAEQWSWLAGGEEVVREGAILIFDTRRLTDGFYDLRLRALNVRGSYNESFVRGFEVRNANPPTPTPEATRTVQEGDSPLPTVSPIETPQPTPTQGLLSFIPGGQGIYKPGNGETLKSVQAIVGTANSRGVGRRFWRYEIYLSLAGTDDWQWLYSSQQQYFNDVLYRLDTARWANGTYDLRLRVVYQDSNYDEYFVQGLTIANDPALVAQGPTLTIRQPRSGATVAAQMDILGTVIHPQLARWELYWAPSRVAGQGEQGWLLLYSGDYQVVDDLIARVDLGQVVPGSYDVRLRLVQRDGNYEDAFIRRLHVALPTPTPPPSPHR